MKKNLLLTFTILITSFLFNTKVMACTDSVATYSNGATVTFVGVKYDYPVSGRSTWYYTVKGATSGNGISHVNFGLGTCVSTYSGAGTWTSFTSLSSGGSWALGNDGSHPSKAYGLKYDQSIANNATVNLYFTIGSNLAVGTNKMYIKPGPTFLVDDLCGPSPSCGALPVKLISFKVTSDNSNNLVKLNWTTASEINNSHFEIERSVDIVNWENIGAVKGNGTSNQVIHYNFKDEMPKSEKCYYRLKQVDFDGAFEYSPIKTTQVKSIKSEIFMHPNPATHTVNITYNSTDLVGKINLSLTDIGGKKVYEQNFDSNMNEIFNLDLNLESLENGIYFVHLEGINTNSTQKLIINK